MTRCAVAGCPNQARIAIRTTWPTRADVRSTVYYDDRLAPKTATRYCRACGAELAASLVNTLADIDEEATE